MSVENLISTPLATAGAQRGQAADRRRRRNLVRSLEADLRRGVGGEVQFDSGARALYATDLSIYRHVPIGVVVPRNVDDVIDGFSCRQQIKDGAGRWAMHPAEVIALALEAPAAIPREIPERRYLEDAATPDKGAFVVAGIAAAVGLLALGASVRRARHSG